MTAPRSPTRPAFDPEVQPFEVADRTANEILARVPEERLHPEFLRARFAAPPEWQPELTDEERYRYPGREGEPTPAAVLVPVVMRESLRVLLTQRTAHLNDHAGQISFPGGRTEEHDDDATATALRETEEEVGLERRHVEVIGHLSEYITGTGFSVTPVVGLVAPGFVVAPDPFEVADVFEVPLAFLMDPRHHQRRSVALSEGTLRHFYAMPYRDGQVERFIWGATAAMLRNLYHFLRA